MFPSKQQSSAQKICRGRRSINHFPLNGIDHLLKRSQKAIKSCLQLLFWADIRILNSQNIHLTMTTYKAKDTKVVLAKSKATWITFVKVKLFGPLTSTFWQQSRLNNISPCDKSNLAKMWKINQQKSLR